MKTESRSFISCAVGVRCAIPSESAWQRAKSRRPFLVLSAGQVTRSAICDGLRCRSQKQVLGWIDQLETLGFLEIVSSTIPGEHVSETQWDEVCLAATVTDARLRQGAPDQLVQ